MREAYDRAEEELRNNWGVYKIDDIIPSEKIQVGQETERLEPLGLLQFNRLFNSRQLLVHAELVKSIHEVRVKVIEEEQSKKGSKDAKEYSDAIATYLTLALGKCLCYNSILTSWNTKGAIRSTFNKHAYGWTWDHGEGDITHNRTSYSWCLKNTLKSLKGIVNRKIEKNI